MGVGIAEMGVGGSQTDNLDNEDTIVETIIERTIRQLSGCNIQSTTTKMMK